MFVELSIYVYLMMPQLCPLLYLHLTPIVMINDKLSHLLIASSQANDYLRLWYELSHRLITDPKCGFALSDTKGMVNLSVLLKAKNKK